MSTGRVSLGRRLADGVTMFIVTAASLLLLVYVGFGEGRRIYEEFQVEKVVAHGRIVQSTMENYLRAGLPLRQYVGYATLVDPIVQGIEEISAMAVTDTSGKELFIVTDKDSAKPIKPIKAEVVRQLQENLVLERFDTHHQIVLPLRNRFENVGGLAITVSPHMTEQRLKESFGPLLIAALALSGAFAVFVVIAAPYLARARTPWLQIVYAFTFLGMAGCVVWSLIALYSDGVQGKARAASFTLSQRFSDIVDFNLRFRDFVGIDKVLGEYRRLNPEIREAALILDGTVVIATDPTRIGRTWMSDPRTYEYARAMTAPESPRQVSLIAVVPVNVVYDRVERSVRNFAALFIASGFLAGLFLQVASSMQRLRMEEDEHSVISPHASVSEEAALIVVKPIFFLAVFLEHLTYSFLPKFMQETAVASGLSVGFAAAPFTAYYLAFALSLIPAGYFSDRYGPKPLIWPGLILASLSIYGLALPLGMLPTTILRALSGIGQGMLFIGIQSYILAVASAAKKTQGNAIIVFGFQGGMISGMAIGSLLATYMTPQGIFMLCAMIGLSTALYSLLLIPSGMRRDMVESGIKQAFRRVAIDLRTVIVSGEFLKAILCIGVPAKAILTGAITFALPLLLGQQGYRLDEIGQIIMLYGVGVVASSGYAARLVDRTGSTSTILFWGAVMSGIGLVLVGLMGSESVGNGAVSTAVVIAGVITIGLAHGFVNAPVVTHVAHSELASRIGANPVTTAYRFLERIGHVAGPMMIGQMFLIWGQSPRILAWIGIGVVVLGLLFIIRPSSERMDAIGPEAAR